MIREAARYFRGRKDAAVFDLVPLYRQDMMMQQTTRAHLHLASTAAAYREAKPIEYYRSIKRVFEFLLNRGAVRHADSIYVEYRRAFLAVCNELPPLSHISFLKNIGQYLMAKGEMATAARVMERALAEARARHLNGQVRQIVAMLAAARGGNMGHLATFEVVRA